MVALRTYVDSPGLRHTKWSRQQRRACQVRATLPAYEFFGRQDTGVKVYEQGMQHKKQQGKRVVAETIVRAPVEQVWQVLTDFETLPNFVPNLEKCDRLPNPPPGKVLLRQRGCSQGALWRLEAEAVLEVEEVKGPLGRREARFRMIEGDFKYLSGRWIVEPDPRSSAGMATILRYDISLQPVFLLPSTIISYVVRAGLPSNIKAISLRAEAMAKERLQASGLASWAGVEEDPPIPPWVGPDAENSMEIKGLNVQGMQSLPNDRSLSTDSVEKLPSKGPFWPAGSPFAAAAPLTAEQQRRRAASEAARSVYLGTTWVPLTSSGTRETAMKQNLDESLLEKERLQATYPAFGLRRSADLIDGGGGRGSIGGGDTFLGDSSVNVYSNSSAGTVSNGSHVGMSLPAEVHLRRLDGLDFLHRRAVAAVTVDSPASVVWDVLTDYDGLAAFVPNLAASERIKLPPSAPKNIVRVRQVGYKRLPFVCLHAESVLDLIEKPNSEIQFRQVAGDFERFQGKWILQEVPCDIELAAPGYTGPQTQLKYAVEIIIPRGTGMSGVVEPVLERVVFEDVPINLAAIKQRVESLLMERQVLALEEQGETIRAASLRRKRPRLSEMIDAFNVLAAELERCFGQERSLPTRTALREMNRTDLEKAIAAHGGPAAVTEALGWKHKGRSRKPRGYWDSLPNVKQEVDAFIEENDLVPGVMPLKNDFIRAGRFDIARAVERWGGLYELSSELGYRVSSPVFSGTEWQEHISVVAASTGLSGKQGLFELAAQTYKKSKDEVIDGDGDVTEFGEEKRRGQQRKQAYSQMPTVRQEIDAW